MAKTQAGRPRKEDPIDVPTAFVINRSLDKLLRSYCEKFNVNRSELVRKALYEKFSREGFVK